MRKEHFMSQPTETIIAKLMEELTPLAKTETIIGQPVEVGNFTLLPISKISLGIGAGGGSGTPGGQSQGEGGGGGGGLTVTPVAFVVVKGDEISFHGVGKSGAFDKLLEHIPEMTEKIMAGRKSGPDAASTD
jgi:uncharacterized spore protein YtfJ